MLAGCPGCDRVISPAGVALNAAARNDRDPEWTG